MIGSVNSVKAWMGGDAQSHTGRIALSRLGAPLLYAHDARTFWQRLRGLHCFPDMGPTDAILIRECWSIHTFRTRIPIDVMFLDHYGLVLKVVTVQPGRVSMCWKAAVTVEMAHGTSGRLHLSPGQVFKPSDESW